VKWARRLIELKPQYVKSVRGHDIRDHVILVNNVGMPVRVKVVKTIPWIAHCWLGRFVRWLELLPRQDHEQREYEECLGRMMNNIKGGRKKVAIIVHGGLKSPHRTLAASARILAAIDDEYYPIFIIWDSWLSALPEQLLLVRSGHYSPWGPITAPLLLLFVYLPIGIALIPLTLISQLRSLYVGGRLSPDPATRFTRRASKFNNSVQVPPVTYEPGNLLSWRTPLRFLRWLGQFPIRLVVAVGLNALAPPTWQNLHRRARAMFRAPQEFESLVAGPQAVPRGSDFHPAQGAVAVLAEHLIAAIGTSSDQPIEVTLIAHSMGAMITNEFMKYAGDRLSYANIVYMAPACSVRDFADAVVPVLQRDENAHAYVLTLHPKVEVNDKTGYGLLPRGSVLEWLERFLDPPSAHLDRMLGKFENVMRALHIFPRDVRERIRIKAFSFNANSPTKPFKHVHFNDPDLRPPFWSAQFWV
jgi:hypothetical protein